MRSTSDRIRPADRTSSASCPRHVNVEVVVVDRAGGARPPWFIALAVVSLRSFVKVQGGACVGVRSPMCCFGWGKDTKMGMARGGGISDTLMGGSSLVTSMGSDPYFRCRQRIPNQLSLPPIPITVRYTSSLFPRHNSNGAVSRTRRRRSHRRRSG